VKLSEMLADAPSSTGKRHLLKHLEGGRLTQRQAILAKCCDCMGYYVDGRADCQMPACPLYGFMPYREKRPGKAANPLPRAPYADDPAPAREGGTLGPSAAATPSGRRP